MASLWTVFLLFSFFIGSVESSKSCAAPPESGYGPWSAWSPCSVSCGGGSWTRTRVCTKSPCIGGSTERGHCNYHPCPPTVCDDDDFVPVDPDWGLTKVNVGTFSGDLMIGTVGAKGQKLGLCWRFQALASDEKVTIISPLCNRLRVGRMAGQLPAGQFFGTSCTFEVPEADDVNVTALDAAGVCDLTTYAVAAACPNTDVVEVTFFSQKNDVGVLLNVEPEDDEMSILVGLLGNDSTLGALGLMRYNATMRALPGTPWRAVLYTDNDQRALINGQCSYVTTDQPNQIAIVGPVCGGWGPWGPWEECTLTPSGWRQRRRRPCDSPPPQNDGHCEGKQNQYRKCACAAPVIPNTAVAGVLQQGYQQGDTVEVCCKEGYVSSLTGRKTFNICCDYYNRWENFQTCVRLECPHPVFPHGVVSGGTPPYYRGNKVQVVCNHGYSNVFGKRTFTSKCTGTKWWPYRCVVKRCDPLPSIRYGHLVVTPGVTLYRLGDKVKVTCLPGYTLSPNSTLTCDDNGHWTPSNIKCIATSCPNAIDLFKYNIGSAVLGQPGTPLYNAALLTCRAGYTAGGKVSYTSRCLSDGTWSDLQQCTPPGGVPGMMLDAPSIGLLVGLITVVLLSALFCSLLCCRHICCPPRQPVLVPPPVYSSPVYQAPPQPPCPPKQPPARGWGLMYRLRGVPAVKADRCPPDPCDC